jgi:hypothetical protein
MNELTGDTIKNISFESYSKLPLLKRIRRDIGIRVQNYEIISNIQYKQCIKESLLDNLNVAIPENPKDLTFRVIIAVDNMIKDPIRRSISDLYMLAEVIPGNISYFIKLK